MGREKGFYWIQVYGPDDEWVPANWDGEYFYPWDRRYAEHEIFKIHEIRIPYHFED